MISYLLITANQPVTAEPAGRGSSIPLRRADAGELQGRNGRGIHVEEEDWLGTVTCQGSRSEWTNRGEARTLVRSRHANNGLCAMNELLDPYPAPFYDTKKFKTGPANFHRQADSDTHYHHSRGDSNKN